MKAAVVEAFDRPPRFRDFDEPTAGADEVIVTVRAAALSQLVRAPTGHGGSAAIPRIRFVNIGSLAGANIAIPAGVLRSSGIELTGSGLGRVSHAGLVRAIGDLMQVIRRAGLEIGARAVALNDVEAAWANTGGARIVLTP